MQKLTSFGAVHLVTFLVAASVNFMGIGCLFLIALLGQSVPLMLEIGLMGPINGTGPKK